VGSSGRIFVSALFSGNPAGFGGGAIFEVDRDTGARTLLSNFARGAIRGFLFGGLAVNAQGEIIANLARQTAGGGSEATSAVVRIDPDTDDRVIVSDLTDPDQGEDIGKSTTITDLALQSSGGILIGTSDGSVDGSQEPTSRIFRVRPVSGARILRSDFADPAQGHDVGDLAPSIGMAVEASGRLLVASGYNEIAPRSLLFRIHLKTGERTVLSDFDDPAQGPVFPLGVSFRGVAVENSGKIIVGAHDAENNGDLNLLFRVNPDTGKRKVISDSDISEQGPPFGAIVNIAVVPELDASAL
jgi:hypothetical protein